MGMEMRRDLSIDQQAAMHSAAVRLRGDFDGVFGTETIERFLTSSYDQFAENAAVNTPVQGSAADIIKLAMLRVEDALEAAGLERELLLQVHDELLFEVPESQLEAATGVVVEAMEGAIQLAVPLAVEAGSGATWLEAH